MGISSRRAATGAATTALLFCFGTAGTAAAEEAPDVPAISADQTTEINDRQGWEDDTEQPVHEGVKPLRCDGPSTWYLITSKKAYHIPSWWNGTKFKDGPGGTMMVSVTKSGTVGLEISGSIEWESNAIISKAKATVSTKITGSVTIATGHNYTHEIKRNKYGHLQYGSWGYKLTWKKYRASGNGCDGVEIGRGKATLPTSETGWKYWETST
ncbi:hypothetical protein ACQEVY_18740 [Streptomyces sp. CA-288835]|uniref:hypothetical protein n=1 Tax=Streptomyces sp. CA-288835 TaxID=3240069 RepID=UPI003D8A7C30